MSRAKRILSLSGGGVRGVVAAAFLQAIEAELRRRHGPGAHVSDYFDLVGGTSTGGLIATAIAMGRSAATVADYFLVGAPQLFGRSKYWRAGLAPIFDSAAFERFIRRETGARCLGDPDLRTLLALTFKRIDTGSPWIVSNIPSAPYFDDPSDGSYLGNRHYQLADLVMATTSVPGLFAQRSFAISDVVGTFVDGGLAGLGDPALALLQLARMRAYGLRWPMGAETLSVVSLGTGRFTSQVMPEHAGRIGPLRLGLAAIEGLHGDTIEQTRRMMAWLGTPLAPYAFDSEIGDLARESLAPEPLFSYLHLDLPLDAVPLRAAGYDLSPGDVARLQSMTDPGGIAELYALAQDWCARTYPLDRLLP